MRSASVSASSIEWVTKTTVLPRRLPDTEELFLKEKAGLLVEGAERFVHQQEIRIDRQGAGDRNTLPHALGQLVGIGAGKAGQTDEFDHRGRSSVGVRAGRRR